MKLRREKPLLHRPFKVPLYPFTPIAGIITSLFLLVFIDPAVLSLGILLCVLAILAYYIRMVGYLRFRVAFGGISLSLGFFTTMLAYFIATGHMQLNGISTSSVTLIVLVLTLTSIIEIVAGMLNVIAKNNRF
jgi:hypothetical protein